VHYATIAYTFSVFAGCIFSFRLLSSNFQCNTHCFNNKVIMQMFFVMNWLTLVLSCLVSQRLKVRLHNELLFTNKTISKMASPVWAHERCIISPPCFLAECCKTRLNQASFVFLPRDALKCKARYCDHMSSVCPSVRPSVRLWRWWIVIT